MLPAHRREAILAQVRAPGWRRLSCPASATRVCALDQLTAVITDDKENPGVSAALAAGVTLLRATATGGRLGQRPDDGR